MFGNAAPTLRAASPGSTLALQSADVVLMTAGAAQVASVLPDLTRPPSGRGLRVQAQVRQDLLAGIKDARRAAPRVASLR